MTTKRAPVTGCGCLLVAALAAAAVLMVALELGVLVAAIRFLWIAAAAGR